jgi:hypothetical protein
MTAIWHDLRHAPLLRKTATPAVLAGHAFWQERLASDPHFSRRTLTIDDRKHIDRRASCRAASDSAKSQLWIQRELSNRFPSRTAQKLARRGAPPSQN